jgi:hypothetical protein
MKKIVMAWPEMRPVVEMERSGSEGLANGLSMGNEPKKYL